MGNDEVERLIYGPPVSVERLGKGDELFESPSPESVVVAFGEGPDS
jgi:hypothetical protein